MSFIHEISARRWIYNGQYLEIYPTVYFNLCDKLSYQDIGLVQVLLSLDNLDEINKSNQTKNGSLINFVIDNFGLDQQLQALFSGLRNENLNK